MIILAMKKKDIVLLIVFCISFKVSFGQTHTHVKKINPFQMVHLDDSVKTKLYNYIASQGQDIKNAGMYIYNILGEDKANDYKFVEGVYSFRLTGPHFPLYYFIYTKKDGVQIIKDYSLENLLTQVIICFKRSNGSFDEGKKIAYIEAMINDLNHREDINGDSEKRIKH